MVLRKTLPKGNIFIKNSRYSSLQKTCRPEARNLPFFGQKEIPFKDKIRENGSQK